MCITQQWEPGQTLSDFMFRQLCRVTSRVRKRIPQDRTADYPTHQSITQLSLHDLVPFRGRGLVQGQRDLFH